MSVESAIKVLPTLRRLIKLKQKSERQKILNQCPCNVIKVIQIIARKILKGHIHLTSKQKARIKKYQGDVRRLGGKLKTKAVKKLLVQKGGLLPGLLVPAISILANIVANKLIK